MRNRILTGGLAAGAALSAVAASIAMAPAAHAGLVTYCSGSADNVTVPGDLVVAAGKSCSLTNVTVLGTTRVSRDANLTANGGELAGQATVAVNGYIDLTGVTLKSNLVSNGGYGAYLDSSTVTGNFNGRAAEGAPSGFYFLVGSTQGGNVTLATGEGLLENSEVGGNVSNSKGSYLDAYNSVLKRNLTVTGTEQGGVVCGSEVYGEARYTGNGGGVQLGGVSDLASCAGANFFGKSVAISGTQGQVTVVDNIIAGSLSGTGNSPAPVAKNNRVRGGTSGQFAEPSGSTSAALPRTQLMRSQTSDSVAETVAANTERTSSVKSAASDRRENAKSAAKAAGKAF